MLPQCHCDRGNNFHSKKENAGRVFYYVIETGATTSACVIETVATESAESDSAAPLKLQKQPLSL
jgi:hypothetical protein